jgi:hypothetical protein
LNAWYTHEGEKEYLVIGIDLIEWPHLIIIQGKLPMCKQLLDFQNGALIEVAHVEFGRRDSYHENDVILRLEHCRVERKWIDNLVIYDPSLVSHATVNLQLNADIRFLLEDVQLGR